MRDGMRKKLQSRREMKEKGNVNRLESKIFVSNGYAIV